MTTILIDASKRIAIERYCSSNISPRRYYLHNARGGLDWAIEHTPTPGELKLTAPDEHLVIIRLKYGV